MKTTNQENRITNGIGFSKSIKTLLLAIAITFSGAIYATTSAVKEEPTSLQEKITKLLKNPNFIVEEDSYANVTFMFNKNRELVVLSVDSDNQEVVNYIKYRLNYKKLNVDVQNLNKTFVLPVKIETE